MHFCVRAVSVSDLIQNRSMVKKRSEIAGAEAALRPKRRGNGSRLRGPLAGSGRVTDDGRPKAIEGDMTTDKELIQELERDCAIWLENFPLLESIKKRTPPDHASF